VVHWKWRGRLVGLCGSEYQMNPFHQPEAPGRPTPHSKAIGIGKLVEEVLPGRMEWRRDVVRLHRFYLASSTVPFSQRFSLSGISSWISSQASNSLNFPTYNPIFPKLLLRKSLVSTFKKPPPPLWRPSPQKRHITGGWNDGNLKKLLEGTIINSSFVLHYNPRQSRGNLTACSPSSVVKVL